jgi:hypothetical protein
LERLNPQAISVTGLGDFKVDFRADVATGVLESAGLEDWLVLIDLGLG